MRRRPNRTPQREESQDSAESVRLRQGQFLSLATVVALGGAGAGADR